MQVGDAAAPLAAGGLGEDADREGLEVVREVAADEVATEAVAQEQAGRLEGTAGEHDGPRRPQLHHRRIGVRR